MDTCTARLHLPIRGGGVWLFPLYLEGKLGVPGIPQYSVSIALKRLGTFLENQGPVSVAGAVPRISLITVIVPQCFLIE